MYSILSKVKSPEDLKNLSIRELKLLAQEVRQEIITTVSRTGGHLGSNLGVVELTIALHKVFSSPRDKIIWDVGHQCYTHKILTGRRDCFHTLRQYGGISGFPKREESPHDHFNTGHTSTAISMALGVALARDLNKDKFNVIAVVGDGALTGGLAYEGLNNAGQQKRDIIVILNDNKMSISPNVGAISSYLNRLRMEPAYKRVKEDLGIIISNIPNVGERIWKLTNRFKRSIKYFLLNGMFFEIWGFTYLGPFDGHNIGGLIRVLEKAKKIKGPLFIHTLTVKGKGYIPAETHSTRLHGVTPFKIETGKPFKQNKISYSEVFGLAMEELASKFPRLVAITAAMTDGTGLAGFKKRFPDRLFDVGIAEQHAVSMASGLASEGMKPVVAIYSTFLQRAIDQIILDVCLSNFPVVFAIDRSGVVGEDGPTHHGVFDISLLRAIPNLIIMSPRNGRELRDMLYTALTLNQPVALRYPRGEVPDPGSINSTFSTIPIGKGEVLRKGKDLAFIALGNMVANALASAEELTRFGIEVEVISLRFVKPLDEKLILETLINFDKIIIIEDNVISGGVGSAILELIAREGIAGVKVTQIGLPDKFIEAGSISMLHKIYGMDCEGITKTTLKLFSDSKVLT